MMEIVLRRNPCSIPAIDGGYLCQDGRWRQLLGQMLRGLLLEDRDAALWHHQWGLTLTGREPRHCHHPPLTALCNWQDPHSGNSRGSRTRCCCPPSVAARLCPPPCSTCSCSAGLPPSADGHSRSCDPCWTPLDHPASASCPSGL